jgi:cell division protein FtsQ
MSRFTAIKRPPPRKPVPKWKMVVKFTTFGTLGVLFFLGWFWYSGLLTQTKNSFVKKYETTQIKAGLQVKKIIIKGRKNVSQKDILEALEVKMGDPFSRFDKDMAHSNLSHHPWIKTIQILQQWPDTIHVLVQERVPLALWQYHKKIVLIDKTGERLTSQIKPFLHFPLVLGRNAPRAAPRLFQTLKKYPQIQKVVITATWVGNRRWDLKLKNGRTLMLPEDRYDQSLRTLDGLQKKLKIFDKAKKVIDMRLRKKMVMR